VSRTPNEGDVALLQNLRFHPGEEAGTIQKFAEAASLVIFM